MPCFLETLVALERRGTRCAAGCRGTSSSGTSIPRSTLACGLIPAGTTLRGGAFAFVSGSRRWMTSAAAPGSRLARGRPGDPVPPTCRRIGLLRQPDIAEWMRPPGGSSGGGGAPAGVPVISGSSLEAAWARLLLHRAEGWWRGKGGGAVFATFRCISEPVAESAAAVDVATN